MWCIRYCKIILLVVVPASMWTGCREHGPAHAMEIRYAGTIQTRKPLPLAGADTSELEHYLIRRNLINVQKECPAIRVALSYSTDQNFLHKVIYKGLNRCYLPSQVAQKLCNAEQFLNREYPQYHLVVFDGARPLHIQQQMWDELDMPNYKKVNYLANPADLSLHNYGAAVDVGIISENDSLLNMGTAFDTFSELSQPRFEERFLKDGSLSREAYNNRLLLRRVMLRAGFSMIYTEWWHFNSTNKTTAAALYGLIE